MKKLGLLGGMSWESTATYYRLINEGVKQQLGGLHSAELLLYSVDFAAIEKLQASGAWSEAGAVLSQAAKDLQRAGAEGLVICTNTMHQVADIISDNASIPLIHIADGTGRQLVKDGVKQVGLLGTRFTMEREFYKGYLARHFPLDVVVPEQSDRDAIHQIIYDELCLGNVRPESSQMMADIICRLKSEGCEAVILGCTELAMLSTDIPYAIPAYDTTQLHAQAAVDWCLES